MNSTFTGRGLEQNLQPKKCIYLRVHETTAAPRWLAKQMAAKKWKNEPPGKEWTPIATAVSLSEDA